MPCRRMKINVRQNEVKQIGHPFQLYRFTSHWPTVYVNQAETSSRVFTPYKKSLAQTWARLKNM